MEPDAIKERGSALNARTFKKALNVTDKVLVDLPLVDNFTLELDTHRIDFVISFGGGSPYGCAKGIALVATNDGTIRDYSKDVRLSAKPQLPLSGLGA